MAGDLGPLIDHLPAWLLVLFRLSGIFILAPLFGSQAVPARIKVLLVLVLSFCVYPMLLDSGRPSASFVGHVVDHGLSLWMLATCIGLELLLGYTIGFAASLPMMSMQVGGHIIDTQIGIGAAALFNPDLQDQSGPVGEFFFLMALTLFIIVGGHRVLLQVLVESFDYVPLGGFADLSAVVGLVLGLVTVMLELAMKVAAPLLCLMFLEMMAMGFIARTVPQLNILSVGFALKIIVGVSFLVAFVAVAVGVYLDVLNRFLYTIQAFFGG